MTKLPDDFAFLSDDIVFDVLQFAHFERLMKNFYKIKPFGGRWNEIAHKFRDFRLEYNEIKEYRLDGRTQSFTTASKNRKDVAVNSLFLSGDSDLNEIEHLAADAYESLAVSYKVVPSKFLEKLGNRFTSIVWFSGKEGQTVVDFFKRQLKSPHLRILDSNSPVLTRPEFTDLLVDFVRKKNFQTLKVVSFTTESISERVFLAAYEAWIQRRDCEHLQSSISARISTEDLQELTTRIPHCSWNKRIRDWGTEWSYSEKHPTTDHYKMLMLCNFVPFGIKKLHMSISD